MHRTHCRRYHVLDQPSRSCLALPFGCSDEIDASLALFQLTRCGLAAGAQRVTGQAQAWWRLARDSPASPLAMVSPSLTQSMPSSPLKASSLCTAPPQHHNRWRSSGPISLALFLLPLVASAPSLVTLLASPPTLALPTRLLLSFATAPRSLLAPCLALPSPCFYQSTGSRLRTPLTSCESTWNPNVTWPLEKAPALAAVARHSQPLPSRYYPR